MQSGGQISSSSATYPAVTQAPNISIYKYTLASGNIIQGPMPFLHYCNMSQTQNWDFKAASIAYIKMALDHYLASQVQGDIAISGYTGLACRLENDVPDLFQVVLQHLWHLHPILNEVVAKKILKLKTSFVDHHARDIHSYLMQVLSNHGDISILPLSTFNPASEQAMASCTTSNFCIDSKQGLLYEVEVSDTHIPHSLNKDYPYSQEHLMIPATLKSPREQPFFYLPVISINEFTSDIIQKLSQQHMIESLRKQHIATLECLMDIDRNLLRFQLLRREQVHLILSLISYINNPNRMSPDAAHYLQQHGIILKETCRIVTNVDMSTMQSTYSGQDAQREKQTTTIASRLVQVELGDAKYTRVDVKYVQTDKIDISTIEEESQTETVVTATNGTKTDATVYRTIGSQAKTTTSIETQTRKDEMPFCTAETQTIAPPSVLNIGTQTQKIIKKKEATQAKNKRDKTVQTRFVESSSPPKQTTSMQQGTQTDKSIGFAYPAETVDEPEMLTLAGVRIFETEEDVTPALPSLATTSGPVGEHTVETIDKTDAPTTVGKPLTTKSLPNIESPSERMPMDATERGKRLRLTSTPYPKEERKKRKKQFKESLTSLSKMVSPIARRRYINTENVLKKINTLHSALDKDIMYLNGLLDKDQNGTEKILSIPATELHLINKLENIAQTSEKCAILLCHIDNTTEDREQLETSIEILTRSVLEAHELIIELLSYIKSRVSTEDITSHAQWCKATSVTYSKLLIISSNITVIDRILSEAIKHTKHEKKHMWLSQIKTSVENQKSITQNCQDLFNWLSVPEAFRALNMDEICHELNETLSQLEIFFWHIISENKDDIHLYADLFYRMMIGLHVIGKHEVALDTLNLHTRRTQDNANYTLIVFSSEGEYFPSEEFILHVCQDVENRLNTLYPHIPLTISNSTDYLNALHYFKIAETYFTFQTIVALPTPATLPKVWWDKKIVEKLSPVTQQQVSEITQRISQYNEKQLTETLAKIKEQIVMTQANNAALSSAMIKGKLPTQDERIRELEQLAERLHTLYEIIDNIQPNRYLTGDIIKEYILDMYTSLTELMTFTISTFSLIYSLKITARTVLLERKTTDYFMLYLSTIDMLQKPITRIITIAKTKPTHDPRHEDSHISALELKTLPDVVLNDDCTGTLVKTDSSILRKHADRLQPILETFLVDTYRLYSQGPEYQIKEPECFYNMFCIFKKTRHYGLARKAMAHHVEYLAKSEIYRTTCMEARYRILIPARELIEGLYNEFLQEYETLNIVSESLDIQSTYADIEKYCDLVQTLLNFTQAIASLSELPRDKFYADYQGMIDPSEIEQYALNLAVAEQTKHRMTVAMEYWQS